jgi:hypothetical protein
MSDDDQVQLAYPHPTSDEDMTGPGDPTDVLPGDLGDLMDDPDETPEDDDTVEDEV